MPLPHLKASDVSGRPGKPVFSLSSEGVEAVGVSLRRMWVVCRLTAQHTSFPPRGEGEATFTETTKQALSTVGGPWAFPEAAPRKLGPRENCHRSGGTGVQRSCRGSSHSSSRVLCSPRRACICRASVLRRRLLVAVGAVHVPPSNFQVLSWVVFSPHLFTLAQTHLCSSV